MKILHVTVWPGPPFSGANINCYNFLKRLTPHHRARFIVVTSSPNAAEMTGDALEEWGIANEGVAVIRHAVVGISDLLKGLFLSSLPPYMAFLERAIGRVLREAIGSVFHQWNPDLLVVWWSAFAPIAARLHHVPKVLYACDSPSLFSRNVAKNTRNLVRKIYSHAIIRRNQVTEHTIFSAYDHVVFISRMDAECSGVPSQVPVTWIANGVDTNSFYPMNREPFDSDFPVLVFHGNLAFPPNQESVRFLVEEVGSRMEEEFMPEGFELRIIGSGPDRRFTRLAEKKPWLKLLGYVDNLQRPLASGTVYVAPITMGAGIKNKVLEAMACGLPVVGTEQAFSGLDLVDGVHCVSCPQNLVADKVVDLIRDPTRRSRIGEAARAWIVENANWDTLARRFERVLEETGRR